MSLIRRIIGMTRGWTDGLKTAAKLAMPSSTISNDEAIYVYGGTALPGIIGFAYRVLDDPVGKKLLQGDLELVSYGIKNYLNGADAPEGSVARAYLDFCNDRNFNPEEDFRSSVNSGVMRKRGWNRGEIQETREAKNLFEELAWQHDLMHVLTGYGTDIEGELGLHAFLRHHISIPAPTILTVVLFINSSLRIGVSEAWHIMVEGDRLGRKAKWLFPVEWSKRMNVGLNDVRKEFNIGRPHEYQSIVS